MVFHERRMIGLSQPILHASYSYRGHKHGTSTSASQADFASGVSHFHMTTWLHSKMDPKCGLIKSHGILGHKVAPWTNLRNCWRCYRHCIFKWLHFSSPQMEKGRVSGQCSQAHDDTIAFWQCQLLEKKTKFQLFLLEIVSTSVTSVVLRGFGLKAPTDRPEMTHPWMKPLSLSCHWHPGLLICTTGG